MASPLASMLVSLTVVPSLAAKLKNTQQQSSSSFFSSIANGYEKFIHFIVHHGWIPLLILLPALFFSVQYIANEKQIFLPQIDEGRIYLRVSGEPGMRLDEMHQVVEDIEKIILEDEIVMTVFSTIGGSVFGRSQRESSHYSSLKIQLVYVSTR